MFALVAAGPWWQTTVAHRQGEALHALPAHACKHACLRAFMQCSLQRACNMYPFLKNFPFNLLIQYMRHKTFESKGSIYS